MRRIMSSNYMSVAACTLVAAASAGAQAVAWKAPALKIVDSVRTDPNRIQALREGQMALRADGSIAVLGYGGMVYYLDSLARQRWTREVRDSRWANVLNWRGDSLFLVDNFRDEAIAIGMNGGVGDYIEFPDLVRPAFKDRRSMTAYGTLDVSVVIDSTLVGAPRNPHRMGMYGATAKTNPELVPIVRTNYDGIVQTLVATVRNSPRGDTWSILKDGRVVIFRPAGDSVAFITISSRGDTLFARKLPKPRVIFNAVGGPDGTIWVGASAGGKEFTHTAFDARGVAIGQIVLPSFLRFGAGDARHAWMFDSRGQNRPIVRYTLRP
jgi:hypothetical protein